MSETEEIRERERKLESIYENTGTKKYKNNCRKRRGENYRLREAEERKIKRDICWKMHNRRIQVLESAVTVTLNLYPSLLVFRLHFLL